MKYPKKFFSFKNGSKISNETINRWIQECIDYLEADKSRNFSEASCGNTKVTVTRYDCEPNVSYQYEVTVSKNYSTRDSKIYNY